jgi:hypothetical protein
MHHKRARRIKMDGKRSREALSEFLDYLTEKGLMAKATAQARKAAASKVLGILGEPEANDVTTVDLEDVVARFGRLHGKQYTPQSLTAYKSRLRSALDDFQSYLTNPLAFRPSVQSRDRSKGKVTKDLSASSTLESRPEPIRPNPLPRATSDIVPIAIRADLTIYIQGLPFDLSEAEARKIAAVVTAMAQT